MLADKEPLIKKAYGVLKELSQDEQTRLPADAREAAEWDRVAIARNAKAEGEREKAINIAKNLISLGLTVEQISQATGLSINEIEKIKNKLVSIQKF
ncbi:MAG: hypothetical protein FWF57_02770 [Defluviitaleaceae bacterium]|nr:hypothetical protein [Defluviitaleaceae bacterium]